MSLLAEKAEIYFTADPRKKKKLINGAVRRAKGQRKGNYSVFVRCQDFGIIESGWTASGNYGRRRKSPHTFAHI